MISNLFSTWVYEPLYNGLIFFVDVLPGHDVGLAVIALTILVRVVLFPISRQAVATQKAMRDIAPDIEKLKEKYKDNKEEQARAIFALYREHNIRPFSSFFMFLFQIPILLGLYWVFWKGGLPSVDASLLYSFVEVPLTVDMQFLGIVDMGGRSIILAVLAGITQLAYARLSMGLRVAPASSDKPSFSSDLARSMDIQMRYVLPVLIGGIAYTVVAAVPLYWVTSNLFMIGQEYLAGRRFRGT